MELGKGSNRAFGLVSFFQAFCLGDAAPGLIPKSQGHIVRTAKRACTGTTYSTSHSRKPVDQ